MSQNIERDRLALFQPNIGERRRLQGARDETPVVDVYVIRVGIRPVLDVKDAGKRIIRFPTEPPDAAFDETLPLGHLPPVNERVVNIEHLRMAGARITEEQFFFEEGIDDVGESLAERLKLRRIAERHN